MNWPLIRKLRAYNPTSGYSRVMRLAADRIEELEAEVTRLHEAIASSCDENRSDWLSHATVVSPCPLALAAEAKLRAVAELVPEFYRDELEALLKEESKNG